MKRILLSVLAAATLPSCHVLKAWRYRHFRLEDVDRMAAAPLRPAAGSFSFAVDTARYPDLRSRLDRDLQRSHTYAFLVVRNDTILYERYFGGVTDSTRLPSFSVAKSVTAALVGKALEEGATRSLHEPVTNYLPELGRGDARFHGVTIQHVLDMRSGVESSENYSNPFSDVLKLGFAGNVSRPVRRLRMEAAPGSFAYKSVNTQLLALIVEKATGRKLQDYLQEKLWTPLGMEHPATWNTDRTGTVRAFCCLNVAARDYARFGRLFLNKGSWEGTRLLPEDWVQRSVHPDTMAAYGGYRNQWWSAATQLAYSDSAMAVAAARRHAGARLWTQVTGDGRRQHRVAYRDGAYHAEGILGQFLYVNPEKRLLIVRLGHYWSHPQHDAERFLYTLGAAL